MKIAVILGAFSVGSRPLDFDHIWDSPRGLTGTDLAFIRISQELCKLGHEVHMYTVMTEALKKPDVVYDMCHLHDVAEIPAIDSSFDVALSLNEPNPLQSVKAKRRIVYQFLNDFSFVQPGFDAWVDHYIGVCEQHTDYVAANSNTSRSKWSTVPLGCDPELYSPDAKVAGRVLWCSSADRGLHWLLQEWKAIKAAVPHASLRILYHFNYGGIPAIEPRDGAQHAHVREMAQRLRYITYAIDKLKPLGVEHVGSVSRQAMVKEWNAASVFGFSCDTVAFSEGFSVSTLEAHASFTTPIITAQDCLGAVYKDSGALVIDAPVQDHLPAFRQAVIDNLQATNIDTIRKCRLFAFQHSWRKCAEQLVKILEKPTTKDI